jgi:hypothetical protein
MRLQRRGTNKGGCGMRERRKEGVETEGDETVGMKNKTHGPP